MAQGTVPGTGTETVVHVGRQPILDLDGRLYGYELLFRDTAQATAARAGSTDEDSATTATILNAFSQFGGQLLGGRLGFVNLTRAFIVGELPVPFDPSSAVLEVLETIEFDDALVAGARARIAEGHRLALDDFVWRPEAAEMLDLAEIVKLDVLEPSWEEVLETVERCRPHRVRFLAERVEDAAMLERARDAGFELFQGYHLGRPQTLSMERLGPGQATALRMLASLSDPETTAKDVERELRSDPGMTMQLLRIANSAQSGLTRKVSSIRDAVVLVGLGRLRAWMVLISLGAGGGSSDRMSSALLRARTCEQAARGLPAGAGAPLPDAAFTVGLLHGVAETLGVPAEEFAAGLPALADELHAALAGEPGPLRDLVRAVVDYEHGRLPEPGSPWTGRARLLAASYVEALAWTNHTLQGVSAG